MRWAQMCPAAPTSEEGLTSRHPDAASYFAENKKVDSSRGPRFEKLEAQQHRLAWPHIGSCGIISRADPKTAGTQSTKGTLSQLGRTALKHAIVPL